MDNIVKCIQWNIVVIFSTYSLYFNLPIIIEGCGNFNEIYLTVSEGGRIGLNFNCEDSMGKISDFS